MKIILSRKIITQGSLEATSKVGRRTNQEQGQRKNQKVCVYTYCTAKEKKNYISIKREALISTLYDS